MPPALSYTEDKCVFFFQLVSPRAGALVRASVVLLKALSCSPIQSNGSASGPLVASYTGLAISPNPGIQICKNPVMPKKVQRYFFFFFFLVFGMLRPHIACFLSGENCLLPGLVIYPRYLTCCFEICAFLPSPPPRPAPGRSCSRGPQGN